MISDSLGIKYGGVPRYMVGGDAGVVLVHGLTGAPSTVYWMGEYLNEKGFSVFMPRLSGHVTEPSDLYRLKWRDWFHDVQGAYLMMRKNCSRVFVAGLSLGGALTLLLGSVEKPDGLVVMSAPHEVEHPLLPYVPVLKLFKKSYTKAFTRTDDSRRLTELLDRIKAEKGERPLDDEGYYRDWILPAVDQTNRMLKVMRSRLPLITSPTLLIHSTMDSVVTFSNAEKNLSLIGSQDKSLVTLTKSTHVITRSFEMQSVWETACSFIQGHC